MIKNSDSEKEEGDHRSMADHKKGQRKLEWRKTRRKQVKKADAKEENKSKNNSGRKEQKTKNR